MLLVRDIESKEVVGVFAAAPWDLTNKSGFFGTGETFVFRVSGENVSDVEKFSWSGANDFFQTCSPTHLGVGGGGNFALCLDSDLLHCTSGKCLTFAGLEDRSLASKPSFRIDSIELWSFEPFAKSRSNTAGSFSEDLLRNYNLSNNNNKVLKSSSSNELVVGDEEEDSSNKKAAIHIKHSDDDDDNEDHDEYVKL